MTFRHTYKKLELLMTAGIDDVGYVIDTLYLYMNIPEYTHGLMLLHVC